MGHTWHEHALKVFLFIHAPPPRSPPGVTVVIAAAAAAAALLMQHAQQVLNQQPVLMVLCLQPQLVFLHLMHLPRCPLCDDGRISITMARNRIDLVSVFKLLHVRQRGDGNEKQ